MSDQLEQSPMSDEDGQLVDSQEMEDLSEEQSKFFKQLHVSDNLNIFNCLHVGAFLNSPSTLIKWLSMWIRELIIQILI